MNLPLLTQTDFVEPSTVLSICPATPERCELFVFIQLLSLEGPLLQKMANFKDFGFFTFPKIFLLPSRKVPITVLLSKERGGRGYYVLESFRLRSFPINTFFVGFPILNAMENSKFRYHYSQYKNNMIFFFLKTFYCTK